MTSTQKFDIVLETASMNEAELSEYCRRNGLYPEQISAWGQALYCEVLERRLPHRYCFGWHFKKAIGSDSGN